MTKTRFNFGINQLKFKNKIVSNGYLKFLDGNLDDGTLKNVFSDSTGTILNPNAEGLVRLGSDGKRVIYGEGQYNIELYDSNKKLLTNYSDIYMGSRPLLEQDLNLESSLTINNNNDELAFNINKLNVNYKNDLISDHAGKLIKFQVADVPIKVTCNNSSIGNKTAKLEFADKIVYSSDANYLNAIHMGTVFANHHLTTSKVGNEYINRIRIIDKVTLPSDNGEYVFYIHFRNTDNENIEVVQGGHAANHFNFFHLKFIKPDDSIREFFLSTDSDQEPGGTFHNIANYNTLSNTLDFDEIETDVRQGTTFGGLRIVFSKSGETDDLICVFNIDTVFVTDELIDHVHYRIIAP